MDSTYTNDVTTDVGRCKIETHPTVISDSWGFVGLGPRKGPDESNYTQQDNK